MTIANSAETIKPLLKGDTIADSSLISSNDESTSLFKLIDGKAAVIVFYRGNW